MTTSRNYFVLADRTGSPVDSHRLTFNSLASAKLFLTQNEHPATDILKFSKDGKVISRYFIKK